MKNPQPVSPVASPRTSSTAGVFSQVRTAVDNRLNHTIAGHNRLPNLIASGQAAKPRAVISNDMVAAIEAYSPKPGRQMARHMRLDVRNTPPPQVDSVIDAIQRYLDIRPRREPTADPKDEASIARHPQQIIQSSQRWDDAMRYQFASNGVENYQFRPEYHAWAGSLNLTLENEGSADIAAPPTRSPMTGHPLTDLYTLGRNVVHDPVDAAQAAMGQMLEMKALPAERLSFGPPIMTDDPYFDPAHAAQNAVAKIINDLGGDAARGLKVGPGNYVDDPDNNPAFAFQNTMAKTKAGLQEADKNFLTVGPSNITDDPASDPAYNIRNTIGEMQQRLNHSEREFHMVGQSNITDDPDNDPAVSYQTVAAEIRQRLDRPEREFIKIGQGNVTDDPAKDPAYNFQNTISEMQQSFNRPERQFHRVGQSNYAQEPANDPAFIFQNTIADTVDNLKRSDGEIVTVGPANQVDDPEKDPVYITENIVAQNLEYLNREGLAQVRVGVANMTDNIRNQPRQAWYSSTQVAAGLAQQSGTGLEPASAFRPLAENDAYIRAIRIIDGLNRIQSATPIVGSRA